MLQVTNLTKIYKQLVANDHLSFTVDPGEIAVMVGPNGAGKSTAIKSIAGLLRYSGEVLICGHSNKTTQAKREFGYIPELPALYDLLTVSEHFEFIARAYRLKNWEERRDALMSRLELTDKAQKLGRELSKGMQQKVSIGCALLHQPKVVLLDEPLVGLDPHAIKELKQMLLEMRNEGCSVLVSTHMLDSVQDLWDKALILVDGKVAAVRTRKEIEQTGENLEELFFSITENSTGVVQ